MVQFTGKFGRTALAASTALALTAAMPAMAAPGKPGMCHPMAGNGGMSTLVVTGEGEARVAPDMASITLGVTTQAESAAQAMTDNSTRQTAVIEALSGAGIEAADIQTSGLNLAPVMDYAEGRAPSITGYQATNTVTVRVKEVARLGEVLDAIVGAGANEINGIAFMRDDGSDTNDEARRDAVEDARHKAEVLAEAAGLTLGPILSLRDAPVMGGPQPMRMRAEMAADSGAVPIAAGEVAMTAQIEVEYVLMGDGACAPQPPRGHGDHGGHGGGKGPGDDGEQPAPGDVPPPMGTDTGAPGPDEPLLPGADAPTN